MSRRNIFVFFCLLVILCASLLSSIAFSKNFISAGWGTLAAGPGPNYRIVYDSPYAHLSVSDNAGGAIFFRRDDVDAARIYSSDGRILWSKEITSLWGISSLEAIEDGFGGAIAAWNTTDYYGLTKRDIYAQRLDANGNKLWGSDGLLVSNSAFDEEAPVLCSDGSGGAWIAWKMYTGSAWDLGLAHVNSSGVVAPIVLGGTGIDFRSMQLVSDGAGGCILAAHANIGSEAIITARLNNSGPVWSSPMVAVKVGNCAYARAVSDGANGAVVTWLDNRSGNWDVYAQKLGGVSGEVKWVPDGVPVCAATGDQGYFATDYYRLKIVSGEAGGAIIGWDDYRDGGSSWQEGKAYVQKVDSSGIIKWASNGVTVESELDYSPYVDLVEDGLGGAFIMYAGYTNSNYYPFAQHVSSDGLLLASYPYKFDAQFQEINSNGFSLSACHGSPSIIVGWEASDTAAQKLFEAGAISGEAGVSGNPLAIGSAYAYSWKGGKVKGGSEVGNASKYLIEPLDDSTHKLIIEGEGIEYASTPWVHVARPDTATYNFLDLKSGWPQFHGGSGHGGFSPDKILDTFLNPNNDEWLEQRWEKTLGGTVESSPVASEGIVAIGCDDGKIYAYDASTGAELWQYQTLGPVKCAPAIYNGVVYSGSDDGTLYAIDIPTGALKWSQYMGNPIKASPVVQDNRVYVATRGSGTNKIMAFDAVYGLSDWASAVSTPESFDASPAVVPLILNGALSAGFGVGVDIPEVLGILVAGSSTGYLYAVIPPYAQPLPPAAGYEGLPVTSIILRGAFLASRTGSDFGGLGVKAAPSEGFNLAFTQGNAVFAFTGAVPQRLTSGISGDITTTPAVDSNDHMYVGAGNILYAFKTPGSPPPWSASWTFDAGAPIKSSPLVTGDRIYFGSENGKLYILNKSGTKLREIDLGAPVNSSPALANGILYVATKNAGQIYAFSEPIGALTIGQILLEGQGYVYGTYVSQTPTIIARIQRDGAGTPSVREIRISVNDLEVYHGSTTEGWAGPSGFGTFDSAGSFSYLFGGGQALTPSENFYKITLWAKDLLGFEISRDFYVRSTFGGPKILGTPLVYPPVFKPLSTNPMENTARISFNLSLVAPITIYLYDVSGQMVWSAKFTGRLGYNEAQWNGATKLGGYVGNGIYVYKIITGDKILGSGKIVVFD
ncbi:MAG: PQQ-binding-like beta-propeller repeat protein [Candidatus Saganbacteria bacterium]|nr:PQQ-binding-like beta-propeller repeat protein [Candidatus Saganbacteria bacterium]